MGQIETNNQAEHKELNTDTVEVLYQKMGDRWYAFSLIDDEVFFGAIPQDAIGANADASNAIPKKGL